MDDDSILASADEGRAQHDNISPEEEAALLEGNTDQATGGISDNIDCPMEAETTRSEASMHDGALDAESTRSEGSMQDGAVLSQEPASSSQSDDNTFYSPADLKNLWSMRMQVAISKREKERANEMKELRKRFDRLAHLFDTQNGKISELKLEQKRVQEDVKTVTSTGYMTNLFQSFENRLRMRNQIVNRNGNVRRAATGAEGMSQQQQRLPQTAVVAKKVVTSYQVQTSNGGGEMPPQRRQSSSSFPVSGPPMAAPHRRSVPGNLALDSRQQPRHSLPPPPVPRQYAVANHRQPQPPPSIAATHSLRSTPSRLPSIAPSLPPPSLARPPRPPSAPTHPISRPIARPPAPPEVIDLESDSEPETVASRRRKQMIRLAVPLFQPRRTPMRRPTELPIATQRNVIPELRPIIEILTTYNDFHLSKKIAGCIRFSIENTFNGELDAQMYYYIISSSHGSFLPSDQVRVSTNNGRNFSVKFCIALHEGQPVASEDEIVLVAVVTGRGVSRRSKDYNFLIDKPKYSPNPASTLPSQQAPHPPMPRPIHRPPPPVLPNSNYSTTNYI